MENYFSSKVWIIVATIILGIGLLAKLTGDILLKNDFVMTLISLIGGIISLVTLTKAALRK